MKKIFGFVFGASLLVFVVLRIKGEFTQILKEGKRGFVAREPGEVVWKWFDELAYPIARLHVYLMDMEQGKDCWVGEGSEELTKLFHALDHYPKTDLVLYASPGFEEKISKYRNTMEGLVLRMKFGDFEYESDLELLRSSLRAVNEEFHKMFALLEAAKRSRFEASVV